MRLQAKTTEKKHWLPKSFAFNYAFSQHLQVHVLTSAKRSQGMLLYEWSSFYKLQLKTTTYSNTVTCDSLQPQAFTYGGVIALFL